jgi:dihydrofolate reductase
VTRTQYYTATTIDGFIADERNSLDWLFEVEQDAAGQGGFASFFADVGAMVMGSTTYTWVFEHERLHEQPEKWRDTYGVAPTWVFTHRELPRSRVPPCRSSGATSPPCTRRWSPPPAARTSG